jgi:putative heme-binding domain-containing protein
MKSISIVMMCFVCCALAQPVSSQESASPKNAKRIKKADAKHEKLPVAPAAELEDFSGFAIYENTAPRPESAHPVATELPLKLQREDRIAFIGNTLFERAQELGHFEAMLHQRFASLQLQVRHLAWSADAIDVQTRPSNFADTQQHLLHQQTDVIFAAFGFNESFAGTDGLEAFSNQLTSYLQDLKAKSFNGRSAARIVLVSPIANENIASVAAADLNNAMIGQYVEAMRVVAAEQQVGFTDVFSDTAREMASPGSDLTINGVHLNRAGDEVFSRALFRKTFGEAAPQVTGDLLAAVVDKNQQFFRRFRPLNTFYYTGGRNKEYGYLDFLPAMRNFDLMVANRDQRIWDIAQGKQVTERVDDSNVPPLPKASESRGANEWMTAADELKAFEIDQRFEVNLFAGEEQFPDIANPIQMRWDSRGRLWVSCSLTYPHVYPGNEPVDKIVILEDVDGDGRADKSTVFADDLHIPLSFELGHGGVFVSEQPHLSFLRDTDGDDRADVRIKLLSGFGTEDSHHALHDFTWTPDGDLLFRESIFHHSQVETPYGPVRQQNSGWFRFSPRTQRLISFGTYPSTNPWGVTFDDWGQHMASHPIYAAAFHALDPEYPLQQAAPKDLQAYSGTCGQQFVDSSTFPKELQNGFVKVRYKPTNRVEIHRWKEGEFGFEEEYVSDLLFSTNLSFIPVDLQFGPRGDLYVCDWYNPVKGHAQYSLRDERRDRHSGRIWRITAKGHSLREPPKVAGASIDELLELLKRPEYFCRNAAKRELRERGHAAVHPRLCEWVGKLEAQDLRYRHHQLEALWTFRWLGDADLAQIAGGPAPRPNAAEKSSQVALDLLQQLLSCGDHHARAAATQQLRYWHPYMNNAIEHLQAAANDSNGIVRMEAAIAATYIGTAEAFSAMRDVLKHPQGGHLAYAISCALGSASLRRHWQDRGYTDVTAFLASQRKRSMVVEPKPTAADVQFDRQPNLKVVKIDCVLERMLFTTTQFAATVGQPIKIVFTNEDATDHNLVIVKPGALAEVGMAANEMARDPRNANSDFIPREKEDLILHATPMIGPNRSSAISVLRFDAPQEPGIYPFVCTFPGHWIVMNGVMVVAHDLSEVDALLAANQPKIIRSWKMLDFVDYVTPQHSPNEKTLTLGMQAFVKAGCSQCHVVAGHGVNLGPDLVESIKQLRGMELLKQIIEPSSKIHEKFQTYQFLLDSGQVTSGVIVEETPRSYKVATNLLTPTALTTINKKDVDEKVPAKVSAMPEGLVNVLTREEILDMLAFVEAGANLPPHMRHDHGNHRKGKPSKSNPKGDHDHQ